MPKMTLLLGRKTLKVTDLEEGPMRVGRDPAMDLVIDNPSVSRQQAEIRREGSHWVVEDLGSSNGTFVNGERIEGAYPLRPGDEIGIGKFSLIFAKAVGAPAEAAASTSAAVPDSGGTMQIKPHEIEELLSQSQQTRRAHIVWEAGGQKGKHHFSEQPAVLIGRDALCDVKVPKGPKHHLLFMRTEQGCDVRDLTFLGGMKVGGSKTRRARLRDGNVVEMRGLKVTFVDELA